MEVEEADVLRAFTCASGAAMSVSVSTEPLCATTSLAVGLSYWGRWAARHRWWRTSSSTTLLSVGCGFHGGAGACPHSICGRGAVCRSCGGVAAVVGPHGNSTCGGIGTCGSCSGGGPGAGHCVCSVCGTLLPLSVGAVSTPLGSSWTGAVWGLCSTCSCWWSFWGRLPKKGFAA